MKKMMESCTIIIVSHDMHSVSNLCNRVVVLDKGVQLYNGRPSQAIALYTKLVHTERFSRNSSEKQDDEFIPEEVADRVMNFFTDYIEWLPVPDVQRGGAGEVKILKVSITKDGQPFKTIQKGENANIRLLFYATQRKDNIIFGYTIKDRVGIAIFWENSFSLKERPLSLSSGYSVVEYSFLWPEVYPDEYTLTVGIGEGNDPLRHAIQCWGHNIASFSAVTKGDAVHGILNNPVDSLQVISVS